MSLKELSLTVPEDLPPHLKFPGFLFPNSCFLRSTPFFNFYLIFDMPVPLLAEGYGRGLSGIPYAWTVIKAIPWIGVIWLLKLYFGGSKCQAERLMHGKVVMVTVSAN